MDTFVIVVEKADWDLRTIEHELKSSYQVFFTESRCLEVSQSSSSAYVCIMDPQEDGLFEEWPEDLVPHGPFTAFSVDYRSHTLIESIVRKIAARAPIVIDTNFGDIVSGETFIARLDRNEPRWEWWHWPHKLHK